MSGSVEEESMDSPLVCHEELSQEQDEEHVMDIIKGALNSGTKEKNQMEQLRVHFNETLPNVKRVESTQSKIVIPMEDPSEVHDEDIQWLDYVEENMDKKIEELLRQKTGDLFGRPCEIFSEESGMVSRGYLNERVFERGKINILSAPMGSGKTTSLFSAIEKFSEGYLSPPNVLIICPKISLVCSMSARSGYLSYRDGTDYKKGRWMPKSFVVTMNSCYHLLPHISKYDILIVEEIASNLESCISSITNMTMKNGFCQLIDAFIRAMNKDTTRTLTAIFSDAIITERELSFIMESRTIPLERITLKKYIPGGEDIRSKKKAIIYKGSREWIRDLFLTTQKDKVICGFSSKSYMEDLGKCLAYLSEDLLFKLGLYEDNAHSFFINTDICTMSSKSDGVEKNEFLENPDEFINEKKRCVFHTSVVSSGVSINTPCHVFFQVGYNLSPVDIIQMIGRCRNPLSINILVEGSVDKPIEELNEDMVQEFFKQGLKDNVPQAKGILKMLDLRKKNTALLRKEKMSERLVNLYTSSVMAKYRLCKNTLGEVKKYLKIDSPHWTFEYIDKKGQAPITRDEVREYACSLQHTAAGGTVSYKGVDGLTAYHREVDNKIKEYDLMNNIKHAKFAVENSFLLNGIQQLKHDHLVRFMESVGFGSWIQYFYFNLYPNSEEEENSISSGINLYKCSFQLLNVLCMGNTRGVFTTNSFTDTRVIWLSDFNVLEKVFTIDYLKVFTAYEFFRKWAMDWRGFLSFHLGQKVMEGVFEKDAKSIAKIINLVVAFLTYIGISCIKKHERVQDYKKPDRKTPPISKRRPMSVSASCKEIYEHAFLEENVYKFSEKEEKENCIRCHRFIPDIQSLKIYQEVSHRYFWKCFKSTSTMTHPLVKSLGTITKECIIPLKNIKTIVSEMYNRCKESTQTPSFWFNSIQEQSKKCEAVFLGALRDSSQYFSFIKDSTIIYNCQWMVVTPKQMDKSMEVRVVDGRNPFLPYMYKGYENKEKQEVVPKEHPELFRGDYELGIKRDRSVMEYMDDDLDDILLELETGIVDIPPPKKRKVFG